MNVCKGFTLIELLVVIVILGVMIAMIGPAFTTGSDIARVRTAARGVMQMSRYARTMALLHQTPLDLSFTSDGQLRVAPAGGGGGGIVSASAFGLTNASVLVEERAAAKEAGSSKASTTSGAASPAGESGGSSYVMADLDIEKQYERVTFVFLGYTDSLDDDGVSDETMSDAADSDADATDEKPAIKTFRIRYKSNGTCRPYRVKVTAAGIAAADTDDSDATESLTVAVDVLGASRVEEDEE